MLYLDTSLLVAALSKEAKTAVVHAWLESQSSDRLAISDWVVTEFSAALPIKQRTGHIDAADRAGALAAFARLCAESLTTLPVSTLHFRTAARLADQHSLGLRAADALHLSVCADSGATLNTLDRRLSEAGSLLGVATVLL